MRAFSLEESYLHDTQKLFASMQAEPYIKTPFFVKKLPHVWTYEECEGKAAEIKKEIYRHFRPKERYRVQSAFKKRFAPGTLMFDASVVRFLLREHGIDDQARKILTSDLFWSEEIPKW